MSRPLVSPVIIRPKHGAFKGIAIQKVAGDDCHDCVFDEYPDECPFDNDGDCSCADEHFHYEHAEVSDDKR